MIKRFHRILEDLHVGCEKPRAYFIPFLSGEDSSAEREKSSRFTSLCGEWDFEFFKNVEELDIENENFPTSVKCRDKMTVPMCWQLCLGRGYDVPNYINQDYPFPVDPPYLPDSIPCGFYRRKLAFNKNIWQKYYLNFEGVSSCFYLWVNGKFIGYSQVSHCTSEFEISDILNDGDNTFEVLVVKHCDGSYLEDQDFFRLSGIFRDVYILERDAVHLTDIYIDCKVSDDFNSAEINIKPTVNASADISYNLYSPDSDEISSGKSDGDFIIKLNNPQLWNTEAPKIYSLRISVGGEEITFPVAVKRVEIIDRCLLLNGQKVKLRGINRHDSNPETGYAVSVENMKQDLYILKRGNVNTIRTSHYPNDPRFLEMCDKLGFMIIDEADLETHGMGYNYGDWYWDYWAFLSDSPDWRAAYLDRAERLFERDKNHGCIIMWSLGNESGCGENHRQMANYIRSRKPGAIIHYENARLEYQERLGKDFTDISDVESRMYASIDYLKEYLDDPQSKKPFFYCEYVGSNSTGDIPLYWDNFEDYDNYCGGCVWEYCDHAVNIGTEDSPKYRYGGDFGDWPNDGISCIDGLVFPDRTPRPGWFDMKITYQPFSVKYDGGKICIKNKRYFTELSDLYFVWTIEKNGKVISSKQSDRLNIPPRSEQVFCLFDNVENDGFVTLNVYFKQCDKTEWAEKDFEVGFCQFILHNSALDIKVQRTDKFKITESRTEIEISGEKIRYVFNKLSGNIVSINNGKELISAPLGFNLWRSRSYNSGLLDVWKRARYDKAKQKTYSSKIIEATDEKVVILTEISFAAAAMPPALRAEVRYTFTSDGKLNVSFSGKRTDNAPEFPRFGLNIVMPKDFESIKYLGYGPQESYSDMFRCSRISEYATTVTDSYVHFIKPQECSSHYRTKAAEITDSKGNGLKFVDNSSDGFCFKALHFNDDQIFETMHDDEMTELDCTIVSLDYKIHASNQDMSNIEPWRSFDEKEFSFSYDILPL
jgi:beta-galactosidase